MVMVNSWKAARWHSTLYLTFGQQFLSTVVYCHTRLRLEFSASWESGNFQLTRWIHWVALWSSLDHPPHAHPPTAKLFLSMLCGVPTLFPSSIRDVRCPPLPVYVFSVRCPPPLLQHLALSWILSKVQNLASSSLQDEAIDCLFSCKAAALYPRKSLTHSISHS